LEEGLTQVPQPRVLQRRDRGLDEVVILILPDPQVGRTGEELVFLRTGQGGKAPALGFETELRVYGEFAFELEAGAGRQFLRGGVLPVVRPDTQDKTVARIDQLDFEERLALLGRFFRHRLDQDRQDGPGAPFTGGDAERSDVGQVGHG
jgi:hypothetical protein